MYTKLRHSDQIVDDHELRVRSYLKNSKIIFQSATVYFFNNEISKL